MGLTLHRRKAHVGTYFRELAATQPLRSRWTPGEIKVLTCHVSEVLAETNSRCSTASIAKVLATRGQDGGRSQASLAKAIAKIRGRALHDLQRQVTLSESVVAQSVVGNDLAVNSGIGVQLEDGDDSMSGSDFDEGPVTVESLGPDLESDSGSPRASLGPGQAPVDLLGCTGNEFNLSQESMDMSVNVDANDNMDDAFLEPMETDSQMPGADGVEIVTEGQSWADLLRESITEAGGLGDIDLAGITPSVGNCDLVERAYASLLCALLPVVPHRSRNVAPNADVPPVAGSTSYRKRAARGAFYRKTQRAYTKGRSRLLKSVLQGTWGVTEPSIPHNEMFGFWTSIFEKESVTDNRVPDPAREEMMAVVRPILESELVEAIANSAGTATAGPDGRTLADIGVQRVEVVKHFNLWLLAGSMPTELVEGITTLIPKVVGTLDPASHRPITVSSWLLRLLHKILAGRLEKLCPLSVRQKAFKTGDGLLENVQILKAIIDKSTKSKNPRPLSLAFLDVKKAFDSVSHHTLLIACRRAGMPAPLLAYVEHLYKNGKTRLKYGGLLSDPIRVLQGVRQGDPLSCWIFNAVIDWALESLDPALGWGDEPLRVSHAAFADDIFLCEDSEIGLQFLVDQVVVALRNGGLEVNASKCASMVVKVNRRRWYTRADRSIKIGGEFIKTLGPREAYKYLGVLFSDHGTKINVLERFRLSVSRLSKAPLKPQQRLYAMRVHVLPTIWHQAVLAKTTMGELRQLDNICRLALRTWLKLPRDTPKAFFHSVVSDGGLGVPSVFLTVARLKIKRHESLCKSSDPLIRWLREDGYIDGQLAGWKRTLVDEGVVVEGRSVTKELVDNLNAGRLYDSVDGAGLRLCSKSQTSDWPPKFIGHKWLTDGRTSIGGSVFCKMVGVRSGTLYSGVRGYRWKRDNGPSPLCQACWRFDANGRRERVPDTLGHRLQVCVSTAEAVIHRHNAVVKQMARQLRHKGFQVWVEYRVVTARGEWRPDLIVLVPPDKSGTLNPEAWVLDPTIVADNCEDLNTEHVKKCDKYSNLDVEAEVRRLTDTAGFVHYAGVVFNWRGIMAKDSIRELLTMGMSRTDLEALCLTVVRGSAYIHQISQLAKGRLPGAS